jgi:hypothetical protein
MAASSKGQMDQRKPAKPTRLKMSASSQRHQNMRFSNRQAAVLTSLVFAVVIVFVVMNLLQHDRFLARRDDRISSVSWDPSWPELPISKVTRRVPIQVSRIVYSFAALNADVLAYIPCYCGCRSQGHRSNHDCYIKQRSADGRVVAWDEHGLTCPFARNITGDVSLWREQGKTLSTIRRDIEQEYASRGPATPTPPVPTE